MSYCSSCGSPEVREQSVLLAWVGSGRKGEGGGFRDFPLSLTYPPKYEINYWKTFYGCNISGKTLSGIYINMFCVGI